MPRVGANDGWALALAIDTHGGGPVFLQIARAIAEAIRRGRLRPGTRLPGSRSLARALAVHRNTVIAAYDELTAEGWIRASEARGTFVSPALPEVKPRGFSDRSRVIERGRIGFDLRAPSFVHAEPAWSPPSTDRARGRAVLVMSGGIPDVRLVPTDELARAYRRALRRHAKVVLGYGDPQGHPRLRAALAGMLSSARGLALDADEVLVTRGSQMALDLVGRALLERGDVVAVEALGYRPAWEAFRQHGADLVPIPIEGDGLDVGVLESIARRKRLRAVYVTPHHQYPTTVTLSPSKRMALLDLAERHRLPIIEDDYDHEFHYDGRPILPLASADQGGVVIYIGTLSKILAPGLRLGYVVAPPPLLSRLRAHRIYVDRQGDQAVECAVADLLEEGHIQRHARRAKRIYHARRDLFVRALARALGDRLDFAVPPGGLALWVEARGVDVDAWCERALRRGAVFFTAKRFAFDGRARPLARLGFASLDEAEIAEAIRRLSAAMPP